MVACIFTILFAVLFARFEAIVWHLHAPLASYRGKNYEDEIHLILVIIRIFFAFLIYPYVLKLKYAILCLSLFFYLHKSALYFFRHKENDKIYVEGWFASSSNTSGSWLDRNLPITGTYNFRYLLLIFSFTLALFLP